MTSVSCFLQVAAPLKQPASRLQRHQLATLPPTQADAQLHPTLADQEQVAPSLWVKAQTISSTPGSTVGGAWL